MTTKADADQIPEEKLKSLLPDFVDNVANERFWKELAQLAIIISRTTSVSICFFVDNTLQAFASAGNAVTEERVQLWESIIHDHHYTEIEDTLKEAIFKFDSRVFDQPVIRFLAGMPIVTADGIVLGTIGLADSKPRKFSGEQIQSLGILSRIISTHLEMSK